MYKEKTGTAISYSASGNATAADMLIKDCQFVFLSRPMYNDEFHRVTLHYGESPKAIPVALDALAIVASDDFPSDSLSPEELRNLFTSKNMEVSELFPGSGHSTRNKKIQLFGIDSASDEYRWFKDSVLRGDDYTDLLIELRGPEKLQHMIQTTPLSLGYIRYSLVKDERIITIKNAGDGNILPSPQSISNETYPLIRYMYLYVLPSAANTTEVKTFIDTILTRRYQNAVLDFGFYPMK